ncbi:MAG: NAD(P)-dependent oxidoreductase [Pseudomonadota bacterium]
MGERVFVTGANGQLGVPLIRSLVADGHEVVGLARTERRQARVLEAGAAACLLGDLYDIDTLVQGCTGAGVVFHLAGAIRGKGQETSDRINRMGTANLLAALARSGPPPRAVVFASSCAVYGDRSGLWLEEDMEPTPQSNYGTAKAEAEALLLEAHAQRGLPVRIARIGIVYGPRFAVLMEGAIRRGRCWLPGEGQNLMPIIHVEDAIAALMAIAERGEDGKIYHVSTWHPVEARAFYQGVAERVGGKPPRFWSTYVPTFAQRAMAGVAERAVAAAGRRPLLTPDMLSLLTASVRLKPERLEHELGFSWAHPELSSGLDATFSSQG